MTITIPVIAKDGAKSKVLVAGPKILNVDPWIQLDGRLNAPSGVSPQHPTILNGYPTASPPNVRKLWPNTIQAQPPFHVAGVDYGVGANSLATQNPATISQTGVSVNTSTKTVGLDNDNVTLSNVDFSIGGYQVTISGNNCTLSNCKFSGGGGNWLIYIDGSNPTLQYLTMDGSAGGNPEGLINFTDAGGPGSGLLTIQYCWFKNFEAHVLDLGQSSSSTIYQILYRYNLIEQGGIDSGAHLNVMQFDPSGGTCNSCQFIFNTGIENGNQAASGGEWDQWYSNGGATVTNCQRNYNTTITQSGATLAIGNVTHGGQTVNLPAQAHDNYYDPTNMTSPFFAGSITGWVLNNNINMLDGSVYPTSFP
jgi:hypothetical protein